MTTISSTHAPPVAAVGVPLALTLTGAALAGNGLLFGSQLFFDSRDYSQIATGGVHLAHYVVWMASLIALSQLYPRLDFLRSQDGRRVPAAVLTLAGVGAALDACARFVLAFVTPHLAANEPSLVDSAPDAILLVPLLTAGIVAMLGTASLGVIAWRRRILPWPAAALLVVGGVAIPVLGPLSNVLLGAALVWIGSAARGRH